MKGMSIQYERIARLRLSIPEPFDFELTVAKPAGWHWSTPSEVFEGGVLWTATRLGAQAVGLRLSSTGEGRVNVDAFTRQELEKAQREELRSLLEYGLGKSLDLQGFYAFARNDAILKQTVRDRYGMRIGRLDDLFGRVILAITLQMAQLNRSRQMMSDILSLYGTKVRFAGREIVLWPAPRRIAGLDEKDLRVRANMGYRARLLLAAAQYLSDKPESIRELDTLPDDEAVARVRAIPGIGEYSAGIVMARYAPIDAWSVIVMSELLLGKTPARPRAEIDSINELIRKRWGKWSWMAFAYILNDLENLADEYGLTRLV